MTEWIDRLLAFDFDQAFIFGLLEQNSIFVFGFTAILASLGVILCSSPIYSALYLIGNMICLALLFLFYNAEFLAAVQVVVYAGAVMILFIFIIALLGAKKEKQSFDFEKVMALNFVFLLFAELLMVLGVGETKPMVGTVTEDVIKNVGSAKAIGLELYSNHLIPFELASVLLLVAAVGIICLAKFTPRSQGRRTS